MKFLRTLCLIVAAAVSPAAMAHAVIKQSVPAHGAKLAVVPKEVTITFNEKVEKMFTSATLTTAAGATVATGKATIDPANPSVLRLPLPVLQSGAYVVKWNAVGRDGHRRTGDIGFTIH